MESDGPDGALEGTAPEAAQGRLRDALAGLRNLAQLLHSVRVGPRSIEDVLPDVHAAAASIEELTREVLAAVAKALPDSDAATALAEFVAPRASELERTLAAAVGKPVNAKARLALEHAVTRLLAELEGARELLGLLDEAAHGGRVRVRLVDLLGGAVVAGDDGERCDVTLSPDLSGEALLNPRVGAALVGLGACLFRAETSEAPVIRAVSGERGVRLIVERGAGSETASMPALPLIEPTLACARAAAHACGGLVEWEPAVPRFTLHVQR
jgi:hypothetical protein